VRRFFISHPAEKENATLGDANGLRLKKNGGAEGNRTREPAGATRSEITAKLCKRRENQEPTALAETNETHK
jgi:hypothetical protein